MATANTSIYNKAATTNAVKALASLLHKPAVPQFAYPSSRK